MNEAKATSKSMTEQCFFDLLKQIRDYAEECNDFAKNHKKRHFPS
jgi:hypothetical protein